MIEDDMHEYMLRFLCLELYSVRMHQHQYIHMNACVYTIIHLGLAISLTIT